MAGPAKVLVVPESPFYGPSVVPRTESFIEMGVRYEPGVPSPMESVLSHEPIVVDGLMAMTGGGALGFPKQFIKLSATCAPPFAPRAAASRAFGLPAPPHLMQQVKPTRLPPPFLRPRRDPAPVACTYSGLRFVSKQALDYAARH